MDKQNLIRHRDREIYEARRERRDYLLTGELFNSCMSRLISFLPYLFFPVLLGAIFPTFLPGGAFLGACVDPPFTAELDPPNG